MSERRPPESTPEAAQAPAAAPMPTQGPRAPAPGVAVIDHAERAAATQETAGPSSDSAVSDDADSDLSSLSDPSPLEQLPSHASRLSHLSRIASSRRRGSTSSNDSDPLEPLELALTPNFNAALEQTTREPIALAKTTTSLGSLASRLPDYEIAFTEDDPDNPRNWPAWYRWWIVFAMSYSTWVIVVYSTSYTAAIPGVMEAFDVTSDAVATLGVTFYLFGLAVGAMVVAPMSELVGRRIVYLVCIVFFTVMVIPSALATSLAEIYVVRFIGYVVQSIPSCCQPILTLAVPSLVPPSCPTAPPPLSTSPSRRTARCSCPSCRLPR